MKHYLTRAQMRELAEIGFNTRQLATHECTENGITYFSLSIGDLIEMLPKRMKSTMTGTSFGLDIYARADNKMWLVGYGYSHGYSPSPTRYSRDELIDALFDLVVQFKKEGKI